MKKNCLSRTAFGLFLAASSTGTSPGLASAAFTTVARGNGLGTTTTFLGRSGVPSRIGVPSTPSKSTATRSTALSMNIFTSLFGNIAQEQKIPYENLPFPGNELGAAAKQGQALTKSPSRPDLALATFSGGCFWGMELAYQRVPGVAYTAVGYAQGHVDFPTYGPVCMGVTGHTEAVMVYYNPKETTYEKLLDIFFDRVDPTIRDGQGSDRGTQYRTGVYFHTPEQEAIARARFAKEQAKYKRPIASELKPANTPFWPAEKYHQQYLEKGGRFNSPQDASKGSTETIRCYG